MNAVSTRRISKTKKLAPRRVWGREQEDAYRKLVLEIQELGYTVRREELKRGHGWRVISGSCRSKENKLVFIDNRLGPQEQVEFLAQKLQELRGTKRAA